MKTRQLKSIAAAHARIEAEHWAAAEHVERCELVKNVLDAHGYNVTAVYRVNHSPGSDDLVALYSTSHGEGHTAYITSTPRNVTNTSALEAAFTTEEDASLVYGGAVPTANALLKIHTVLGWR